MADEKKKEKKKKKERVDINLPNARKSMKRNREMKQQKTNYEDMWKLIGAGLALLLFLFVILGGINQWAFLKAVGRWVQSVGETISGWFSGGDIVSNGNGIYWVP